MGGSEAGERLRSRSQPQPPRSSTIVSLPATAQAVVDGDVGPWVIEYSPPHRRGRHHASQNAPQGVSYPTSSEGTTSGVGRRVSWEAGWFRLKVPTAGRHLAFLTAVAVQPSLPFESMILQRLDRLVSSDHLLWRTRTQTDDPSPCWSLHSVRSRPSPGDPA